MNSDNPTLLWADDEIDLLKPHILFLRSKGYNVETANNGRDAIEMARANRYALVILDENMPGLTGLETLVQIKLIAPQTPVIMITKSEEENIMDQAVGNNIADYLIKPVNPSQILLSIKKNLHADSLVTRRVEEDYRRDFSSISSSISQCDTLDRWISLYSELTRRELELADSSATMSEMLAMQKSEANSEFFKFVKRNYESWVTSDFSERPTMSPDIFRSALFPLIDAGERPFMIVIDNFRLDQWLTVKPLLTDMFDISESLYCSILPTATQYARNAIFSGLMPLKIEQMFPDLWVDEESEEGKNINESPLIQTHFDRYRRKIKFSYTKINDSAAGERFVRDFANTDQYDVNVIVINFIDMLSHARTESRMIRELAATDAAFRSLTESWFRHSPALEIFRKIAASGRPIVLTTDHGTVRVSNPVKVVGDRNTSTNLRYKLGRSLNYPAAKVFEIKQPQRFGLPSPNLTSTYIFAGRNDFFAYPNNYAHYVQYYTDTFQHGGISLEEMLVPLVTLKKL